ncbi:MAG: InlB B-repeat-containing protein [Clostridia bacterium]|nr:InlB B-repeat-containing protein [Clostridia bacterium]
MKEKMYHIRLRLSSLIIMSLLILLLFASCKGVMPLHSVTLMDGEKVISTQSVLTGGRPSFPPTELEEGYEAVWSSSDGNVFGADDRVTSDITLYLSIAPIKYPIVYDAAGGILPEGNPDHTTVLSDTFTLLPATRDGADFLGWIDENGNSVTEVGAKSGALKLTATWGLETFSITYNTLGGPLPENPSTYTVDDGALALLPSDIRGYTFLGWMTQDNRLVNSLEGLTGDLTLTASREITQFPIIYNLDGGTNNAVNPTKYTINDQIDILPPERNGYFFKGWLVNEATSPVTEYEIKPDSVGSLEFTALWEAKPATLTVISGDDTLLEFDTCFDATHAREEFGIQKPGHSTVFYVTSPAEPLSFPIRITSEHMVISVSFIPIKYTLYLDYGDGNTVNYREFTVNDADIPLPIPDEKQGFTFLGWSDGDKILSSLQGGTIGDVSLSAEFKRNSYAVNLDTVGGNELSPVMIPFDTEITVTSVPTREGKSFGGWYWDPYYSRPFDGGKMPAAPITLYAKWFAAGVADIVYSANIPGVAVTASHPSGSSHVGGTKITLSTPLCSATHVFSHWTLNGDKYSTSSEITVTVDGTDLALVACYTEATIYTLDIAADSDLVIPSSAAIAYLDGCEIISEDQSYSVGALTVFDSFLDPLGEGLHLFSLTEDGDMSYVFIYLTDSSPLPEIRIDFDSAYPNAVIRCEIDPSAEYTYTVNGGSPLPFTNRAIIPAPNRAEVLTVTVIRNDNGKSSTVTVDGIEQRHESYYQSCFTYGGSTYDFVVESERELEIITEYACFALIVSSPEYVNDGEYCATLDFIVSGAYAEQFNADRSVSLSRALDRVSIPYQPRYVTSSFSNDENLVRLRIYYKWLNTQPTDHEKTLLPDSSGLLSEGARPDDFNGFYIESCEKTQLIRSMYELESLPFGVRPIFDSTGESQRARLLYETAKSVLRTYVDDGMDDFEKASVFYNYLALTVTYDHTLANSTEKGIELGKYTGYTAYGALVDHLSVCDGYASAYRLLCIIEGIPCEEIVGTSEGTGHAWNKVFIEGKWYGVDSTWSRLNDTHVSHRYLFMNEATLIKTGHVENHSDDYESYVSLIASGEGDYYDIFGSVLTEKAQLTDKVKKARDNGFTVVELRNDTDLTVAQLFEGYYLNDFGVSSLSYLSVTGTDIIFVIFQP